MLLCPTPPQQATGPLKLRPDALREATPWSPGLLDLGTLEQRRQRARLPIKMFHPVCEGLEIDRISEVAPVQEVCRTLWRPTPPLQYPTRPLQLWPHALREAALWMLGLLNMDPLGLGLRRQRASLPSKIIPRAWEALAIGGLSKKKILGLDAGDLPDDVDPLRSSINVWPLRPAYSAALEATPSLPSATARVSPLRAPPVSLAPCQPRAAVPESDNSAFHLFPAPRSVDGIASHVTLQFLPH